MKATLFSFFLLIFISVAAENASIQRIRLVRPSRKAISIEKLANQVKLHAISTNRISNHREAERIFLKYVREIYYTEVTIGSPKQTFRVCIDTYSSYTYVPSTSCSDLTCTVHRRYNSSESETFKKDGRFVDINGFQQGFLSSDDICIGDLCAQSQGFVEMTKDSPLFQYDLFDGCIGIGFYENSTQDVTPFFKTLFDQGKISSPIIGLYLNKTAPNDTIGAELSLGGVDPDRFYAPLNWVPMIYTTEWRFNIDKILSNNSPVACLDGCIANFNYNMHGTFGPTKQVDALLPGVGRFADDIFTSYYLKDCTEEKIAALPVISFIIGGEKYEIRGEDYVSPKEESGICRITLAGSNEETEDRWTIGTELTNNYYTAYDFQKKSLGLAKVKN